MAGVPQNDGLRSSVTVAPFFQAVRVNGPLPTGAALANVPIDLADIDDQMCFGRIGIASPGLNAWGLLKLTTAVAGSGVSTPRRSVNHWAYWPRESLWISSYVYLTSSEVTA